MVRYSRNEKRKYIAAWVVQLVLLIVGAILVGRAGALRSVGIGLMLLSIVMQWGRIVFRFRVRNARLRRRDAADSTRAG